MQELLDSVTAAEANAVGRVGCPAEQEANVDEFYFWVAPDALVEQTQIVRVVTPMGSLPEVIVFGVVEQVFRRSVTSSMHMEMIAHDRNPVTDDLLLDREGVTYAKVRVVNTFPQVLAPPLEGSTVYRCTAEDAARAYEMDSYAVERGVCIGLIRNGGQATAGPAYLDMDFLLGAQAGHLNVNGAAGSATKSSFLTVAVSQTIGAVKARADRLVGTGLRPPSVKAVIFNVKGFDLFHLDRWSSGFTEADLDLWRQMGVESPEVFRSIAYYAPEDEVRSGTPVTSGGGRPGVVRPYSWSLENVIDLNLFDLLFSEEARANENMVALINLLQRKLSRKRTGSLMARLGVEEAPPEGLLRLTESLPDAFNASNPLGVRTFEDLLTYVEDKTRPLAEQDLSDETLRNWNSSTFQALWRRLQRVLTRTGVLRREERNGAPLLLAEMPEDVAVIDVQSIQDAHLQRFVLAAVLKQLVDWRTGPNAARGEIFLVVIDELNRYAPRNASDPITRLFEYVASQMRSRGIILFGGQQQGSRVSEVVIENSQTRVLGRSGGQELADPIWRGFSEGDRKLAVRLGPSEKVIVAPNFREALHVRVPRPPWAMRPEEASDEPPAGLLPRARGNGAVKPSKPGQKPSGDDWLEF